MVRPSGLSVGIGIGVLMLGGSGIAIPTLWSRANHAEQLHDELRTSWREADEARDKGEVALQDARQQLAEIQEQVETGDAALAAAQESKRVLTRELAEMQARNRELTAASGTLLLRDQEVAALVQQLEQSRSDHAALLAQRDAAAATRDATGADDVAVAVDDLVPVRSLETERTRQGAPAESQTTAKPAATTPIRFDDRGWKSVAPRLDANPENRIPMYPYPTYQFSPFSIR